MAVLRKDPLLIRGPRVATLSEVVKRTVTPGPRRRSRSFVRSLWMLVIILLVGPEWRSQAQPENDEYRVKAAFLFHFAQLVEWPPEAMPNGGSSLLLCTIGDDPFHGALENSVEGKSIGSRMLRVRNLKQIEEVHGCQILFVGRDQERHLAQMIAEAQSASALTVGETENFYRHGGAITFSLDNGKLRFEVNRVAAERARLKISSRLLLLAKNVIGKSDEGR